MDLPLGATGLLFQYILGGVKNVAPSSTDATELTGGIGFTYGKEVCIPLPNVLGGDVLELAPVSLKVEDTKINSQSVSGDFELYVINDEIFKLTGTNLGFDWENDNVFQADELTLEAFGGIFDGKANFSFDFTNKKFTGFGSADISFPDDPQFDIFPDYFKVKGKKFFGGELKFNFTDNDDATDDFIKAEATATLLDTDNVSITTTAGFEYYLDGRFNFILFEDVIEPPTDFAANDIALLNNQLDFLSASALQTSTESETLGTEPIRESAFRSIPISFDSAVASQSTDPEADSIYTVAVPAATSYVKLIAEWENETQLAEIQLIAPDGKIISESDFERYDIKLVLDAESSNSKKRSKSAYIRNPQSGSWQIQIVNPTDLGEISYSKQDGLVGRVAPEITILPGVEQIDESQFKIDYRVEDPDSNDIRIDLYADRDSEGYNGSAIGQAIASIPVTKGQGSYILNTEGFAPGEYYLYASVEDIYDSKASYIDTLSNYSTEKISVIREADLSANITANTTEVSVGDNITYTVTATNKGEFDSRGVKMLVTLPENAEIVSTSQTVVEPENGFQQGASDLIFDVGDLQPGETSSVDVTVLVIPDNDGSLTSLGNAAVFLQSKTYDPNPDNSSFGSGNVVTVEVNQPSILDLGPKPFITLERIDRDLNNGTIEVGTAYTYDIAIANTGEATATGIVLTEDLADVGARLNGVTTTQGSYSFNPSTQIITINLGEIAPGETETVSISLIPQIPKKVFSTSTVEYNEKVITDEITIQTEILGQPVPPADLELNQTIDNLNPLVGEQVNITLNLVNQGPGIASGIEITNLLPDGLSFVRANAALGNYNSTTGIWNAGNIRDGVRTSLIITALVEDAGGITNQAEITFTDQKDSDSTPGNGDVTEDDFAAVTIEAVFPNTPPTTSGIDNFVVTKNAPDITFSLFNVFDDAEDADTDLVYRLEKNSNLELFENIDLNS